MAYMFFATQTKIYRNSCLKFFTVFALDHQNLIGVFEWETESIVQRARNLLQFLIKPFFYGVNTNHKLFL